MIKQQRQLCEGYGTTVVPTPPDAKVGISRNVRDGVLPIHGLRLLPEEGTSGWFIWAGGEMSEDEDFFVPLHAAHLSEWCPAVEKFLGLPPGWRFLIGGDQEEAWYDAALLGEL